MNTSLYIVYEAHEVPSLPLGYFTCDGDDSGHRYSVDRSQVILEIAPGYEEFFNLSRVLTHSEALALMASSRWSKPRISVPQTDGYMTTSWAKHKLLIVLAALWMTLEPVRPALAAVLALPLIDLVLALACARKAKRPISSSGLKRTVAKILVYEAATLLAFATETYLTGPLIPAIRVVTGLIGLTELKSCLEHLDELNGSSLLAAAVAKLAPRQPNDQEPK